MSARILLPLRPYIKRYLTIQYGKELCISDRGMVSFLLLNMLEKHPKSDPSTIRPSAKLIDDVEFVGYPIFIGDKYQKSRGLYLTQEKILEFNDSLDDMIREEMYRWCNHPGSIDGKVDFDIVRFRDIYGITEDELPFDNLKRWYYRNRERLQKRGTVEKRLEPQLTLNY